ncbi:MAG: histone deacetylase family protein, partial [Actinomycetota bacterium]
MEALVYADPALQARHVQPGHPERPERIRACLEALETSRVKTQIIEPRGASREDLERVHEPGYLDRLERLSQRGGGQVDPDTYVCPASFEVAVRAAGACCLAVEAALEDGQRSFCLVRPPGHHASRKTAMGFCLVNHVAVGARLALARGAGRVAVVDIDVHHGNGTQDIFWEDSRVLYLSLHQYPWYPGTGALEETGAGPGAGTTVNIPLPAGAVDPVYLAALTRVVDPALRAFQPDLILVSAGFDAHARDPLALMEMSTEGYATMTSLLTALSEEICGGRMVMTLEGGYDLKGLASSFVASLQAMTGAVVKLPGGDPAPHASA